MTTKIHNYARFQNIPVNFPCALIDLNDAKHTQLSRLAQQTDVGLQITLADIIYNGIDEGSPTVEKERELQIFDLILVIPRKRKQLRPLYHRNNLVVIRFHFSNFAQAKTAFFC